MIGAGFRRLLLLLLAKFSNEGFGVGKTRPVVVDEQQDQDEDDGDEEEALQEVDARLKGLLHFGQVGDLTKDIFLANQGLKVFIIMRQPERQN